MGQCGNIKTNFVYRQKNHLAWGNKPITDKKIYNYMPGKALFDKYITEIGKAYEASQLQQDEKTRKWSYSLCSTPLYTNSTVICGFNWGGDGEYKPQTDYPSVNFMKRNDLGSFERIKPYLRSNFEMESDLDQIVQINLCFFRTPKEADLPKKDSELTRPIFLRLLADLRPKRVIAMSARIASELESILLEPKKKLVDNGRRKIELIKSSLPEEYGGGRFMYIPHPNSPVLKQARDEAWKFAFE